jgi:hypothetical protein
MEVTRRQGQALRREELYDSEMHFLYLSEK